MAVKKSVRKAGRPESAGMSADSIKNKISWEFQKMHKNSANNLGKYFSILEEYAMGKGSDTNTISSCKFFIEAAQKFLEEEELEEEIVEELIIEEKKVANGGVVDNRTFAQKKAEWESKKSLEK